MSNDIASNSQDAEKLAAEIGPLRGELKTALIDTEGNRIWIRGYPVEELVGKQSFADMVYLIFKGELPSENVSLTLNACLTAAAGGPLTPSAPPLLVARFASAGNPNILSAMAAATLSLGEFIGAAPTAVGQMLDEAKQMQQERNLSDAEVAQQIVLDYRSKRKRIPGLGHPIFTETDRRAKALRESAEELGTAGWGTRLYDQIYDRYVAAAGKPIAINLDSYVGSLLWDLGFPSRALGPLFMISLYPGIIFQSLEQIAQQRVPGLPKVLWEYTGPARRSDGEGQRE